MALDFYPATLHTDHVTGAKFWENVVPMEGNAIITDEEGNESPNPKYLPFSTMRMSEGNLGAIARMMSLPFMCDESGSGNAKIDDVFKYADDWLIHSNGRLRDMERYVFEKVLALREMARLGRCYGATHIVWA